MRIIASQAEVDALDPVIRAFVDSAWSPPSRDPDTAGLRTLNREFADKRIIMKRAGVFIDQAIKAARDDELRYEDNPEVDGFVTIDFSEDPALKIYRAIMGAWNERRDLGTCQNCGNLFLPGKGRIAKHCSDRCRMQSARSA